MKNIGQLTSINRSTEDTIKKLSNQKSKLEIPHIMDGILQHFAFIARIVMTFCKVRYQYY